jgi:hypothetical protein
VRLERDHIETLNWGLKDIYGAYRRMVKFLNEVAGSGRFDPESYTIDVPEELTREMNSVVLRELSRIEDTVEDFKDLLKWMSNPQADKR